MNSVIDLTDDIHHQDMPLETLTEATTLFGQHGALLINGAINPKLLKTTKTYFEEQYLISGEHALKKKSSEVYSNRYLTPVKIEGEFNNPELYSPSKITPILQALLGDDFVLHAFGAISAFPHAPTQPLHIDHPRLFPESNALDAFFPPYAIHLSIPLIDLNEKTGTTAIWEGSHRKNLTDLQKPEKKLKKELEKNKKQDEKEPLKGASLPYTNLGGCLLTDFRLYHRGMQNQTDRPRPFLYMVFCRSWFNDNTNYPKQRRLKITNAEFRKIPKKYRSLFAQHKTL